MSRPTYKHQPEPGSIRTSSEQLQAMNSIGIYNLCDHPDYLKQVILHAIEKYRSVFPEGSTVKSSDIARANELWEKVYDSKDTSQLHQTLYELRGGNYDQDSLRTRIATTLSMASANTLTGLPCTVKSTDGYYGITGVGIVLSESGVSRIGQRPDYGLRSTPDQFASDFYRRTLQAMAFYDFDIKKVNSIGQQYQPSRFSIFHNATHDTLVGQLKDYKLSEDSLKGKKEAIVFLAETYLQTQSSSSQLAKDLKAELGKFIDTEPKDTLRERLGKQLDKLAPEVTNTSQYTHT